MTDQIGFHHVTRGDEQTLTVYGEGETVVVNGDHPLFDDILAAAKDWPNSDFEEIKALADTSYAVAIKFEKLTERVAVANGRVYFDGDEIDNSLSRQIIRLLDQDDVAGWSALVDFMENIAANPVEHSREQLYDWLNSHEFTIARGGLIVGYKGVHSDGDGGYRSGFAGHAIVNGEEVTGHIPNAVGDEIIMPRTEVQHDPRSACSSGLHVGTFEYARAYANGAMLRVLVNPRDVVSVPTDAGGEKVRVCRYVVDEIIDAPETAAYLANSEPEPEDSYEAPEGNPRIPAGTYVPVEHRSPKNDEFYVIVGAPDAEQYEGRVWRAAYDHSPERHEHGPFEWVVEPGTDEDSCVHCGDGECVQKCEGAEHPVFAQTYLLGASYLGNEAGEYVPDGEHRAPRRGDTYVYRQSVNIAWADHVGIGVQNQIILRPVEHADYVEGKGFYCYTCGWVLTGSYGAEYSPEDREQFLTDHRDYREETAD